MEKNNEEQANFYLKGRGSQCNPQNKFLKNERVKEHIEGIDDWTEKNDSTQYLEDNAKGILAENLLLKICCCLKGPKESNLISLYSGLSL